MGGTGARNGGIGAQDSDVGRITSTHDIDELSHYPEKA